MKIAIYLNNSNIPNVCCSNLTKGNPGVGGTEYTILLLTQLYKRKYSENEVYLIVNCEGNLPNVDKKIVVNDVYEAVKKAKDLNVDVFLISAVDNGKNLPASFFKLVDFLKVKTIIWGHNFYLSDFCNLISKCNYVKANVFVGRQQYDRYIDHKIIKKSTYIYNMYPEINDSGRKRMDTHIVTYIGSLVPQKGFHVLANAWKSILEKVPDAELYVIGSGKLYSRNATLGKYSIAEQTYEELFMDGLTDKDGMVLPSVHFLGVMGSEKKEIILKTAVGVPNPTGRTETFGISALDFEALGTPVVTIAKGGFLDTVIDKRTGRLYHSTNELAMMIVELLTNKQLNEEYGRNGIYLAKEFAPEKIICQWDKIFKKVMTGESMEYIEPNSFLNNNLKLFRIINRKIKNTISLEYPISVIGIESVARKVFRLLEKCRG